LRAVGAGDGEDLELPLSPRQAADLILPGRDRLLSQPIVRVDPLEPAPSVGDVAEVVSEHVPELRVHVGVTAISVDKHHAEGRVVGKRLELEPFVVQGLLGCLAGLDVPYHDKHPVHSPEMDQFHQYLDPEYPALPVRHLPLEKLRFAGPGPCRQPPHLPGCAGGKTFGTKPVQAEVLELAAVVTEHVAGDAVHVDNEAGIDILQEDGVAHGVEDGPETLLALPDEILCLPPLCHLPLQLPRAFLELGHLLFQLRDESLVVLRQIVFFVRKRALALPGRFRAHPGDDAEKFIGLHGLDEVCVGANAESQLPVLLVGVGRGVKDERDGVEVLPFPALPAQLEPVHSWHEDVGYDEVAPGPGQVVEGLPAVMSAHDLVARGLKHDLQVVEIVRIVVGDKDLHVVSSPWPPKQRFMSSTKVSGSMGFSIYPEQPASSAFSRSPVMA